MAMAMAMCDVGARVRRGLLVAVVVLGALVGPAAAAAGPALPATGGSQTYEDVEYSADLPQVPTAHRQQSQLWFQDGAWWAVLSTPEDGTVRVAELMPDHTWRLTGTATNVHPEGPGDVLAVGNQVYVVSAGVDEHVVVSRLSYVPASREYAMDDGFPVEVPGSSNAVTVARDSGGDLWLAFTTTTSVRVLRSGDDGRSWSAPFDLPGPEAAIGRGNVAAVVAFDDSVGVMWSDEQRGAFRFATHANGAPLTDWTVETALEGPGMSDDHLSVKVLPGEPDTVLAAVKTSQGDAGESGDAPLLLVLRRSPDGRWTSYPVSTVRDGHTRPTLLLDRSNGVAYVVAQAPLRGGSIYLKSASVQDLAFPPGRGTLLMRASTGLLSDPTSTKQPVDARTGMVVLAVDRDARRYVHGEMPIALPPGASMPGAETDSTAPSAPVGLRARPRSGDVLLQWNAANDGEVWWPDADGMPVKEYEVLRDGRRVGTTAETAFRDTSVRPGVAATYAVEAVDWAGNRSGPSATVRVVGSEEPGGLRALVGTPSAAAGLAVLLLAAGLGSVQLTRWRHRRRIEV